MFADISESVKLHIFMQAQQLHLVHQALLYSNLFLQWWFEADLCCSGMCVDFVVYMIGYVGL